MYIQNYGPFLKKLPHSPFQAHSDTTNCLQGMSAQIMNGEEGKECLRAYSAILASLQQYEQQHREEWAQAKILKSNL
jgi:hypothetical protein